MSDFLNRKLSTLCSPIAVYTQNESQLLRGFALSSSQHLLQALLFVFFALILGSVLTPVHCKVGAGWGCGQGHVMSSSLPADAASFARRSCV